MKPSQLEKQLQSLAKPDLQRVYIKTLWLWATYHYSRLPFALRNTYSQKLDRWLYAAHWVR